MNQSTTHFAKLNDDNYTSWSIVMEAKLIHKGLWTGVVEIVIVVDKKTDEEVENELKAQKLKRKADKMVQAQSEMILQVELGQLTYIV